MRAVLALSPRAFSQRVRVLEHLRSDALVNHAIASALLLPNAVLESPELSRVLENLGAVLRERCERLFVGAPSTLRAENLESEEMRAHLVDAARALCGAQTDDDAAVLPELCVIGNPERDRVTALLCELERAPLGSAVPWMLVVELLGTTIRCRGSEHAALAEYRTALVRRLAPFAEQSPEIFLCALVSEKVPALCAQLRGAVDALRAAVALS